MANAASLSTRFTRMPARRTRARVGFVATLVGSLLLASVSVAHAEPGLVLDKSALDTSDRQGLEKAVAAERAAHPEAFRAVEAVRADVKRADANKRGRLAPVGPRLRELGPSALLPMLELLALDAPRDGLESTGLRALQVGLLEAVGALRDSRSENVLVTIARAGHADAHVALAAGRALGRLSSDAAVATLRGLAAGDVAARRRAATGLGECRREASVAVLATLAHDADEETRELALRALGQVGNAQAWKSSSMVRHEEAATRKAAAAALVPLFVEGDAARRAKVTVALLLVDHVETPALLAAQRDRADARTQADVDRLLARLAKNPTR